MTTRNDGGLRLTEKRLRILRDAARHSLGLVTCPYIQGFERVAWNQNARALVGAGLLASYVHGGYEITDSGRDALTAREKEGR